MQAELLAASRHEHLVLYDPAAIPADTPVDPDLEAQDPKLLPAAAMMQLAARGEALVVRIREEDCEARFRVFVDEEPPEGVRSRAEVLVAGARLRLPGGILRADGLEFLCRPGESRPHSEPHETALPRGRYAVELLNLLPWKAANRVVEGRRGVGRLPRAIQLLVTLYTWLGILMFPANLFVAPVVVARFWRTRGWEGAAVAVLVILGIDALILAGFWVLQVLQLRVPALFRAAAADAAFERKHPDFIVVLRASDDGAENGVATYAEARATSAGRNAPPAKLA